jgi:DNA-binding transcriptional LysR family regulator
MSGPVANDRQDIGPRALNKVAPGDYTVHLNQTIEGAMNRIEAMQAYVRVAELASFTQAADSLGLSRASVSTAIRELEGALGTQLLHRTTRKVRMSEDGQAFYERSRQLLDELDDVQAMFQQESELTGRLRVDMPVPVARNIVIPQLPAFLRAHPRLRLDLSSTDRRVDVVKEGFDCILRVGPLESSSLVARPLGHFRMVNCASPDYVARAGMPTTLAELAAHQLVDYAPSLGARGATFEYLEDGAVRSCTLASALAVNSVDAYQAACLAGLGIIQVPLVGVADLIARGQLVALLDGYRAPPMAVTLLYQSRRHLSKRTLRFMQWLAGIMQPHLS